MNGQQYLVDKRTKLSKRRTPPGAGRRVVAERLSIHYTLPLMDRAVWRNQEPAALLQGAAWDRTPGFALGCGPGDCKGSVSSPMKGDLLREVAQTAGAHGVGHLRVS